MEDKKINNIAINNIYKNANMALQSISCILQDVESDKLKQLLLEQYEGYEKVVGEISSYMIENGYESKPVNGITKAMVQASTKMHTMKDSSTSHIAEMMIKGTMMGVTELIQMSHDGEGKLPVEILNFAIKLKDLEEGFVEQLKAYL